MDKSQNQHNQKDPHDNSRFKQLQLSLLVLSVLMQHSSDAGVNALARLWIMTLRMSLSWYQVIILRPLQLFLRVSGYLNWFILMIYRWNSFFRISSNSLGENPCFCSRSEYLWTLPVLRLLQTYIVEWNNFDCLMTDKNKTHYIFSKNTNRQFKYVNNIWHGHSND